MATHSYYRVWMKDGYAVTINAESEDEAKKLAVQQTERNLQGTVIDAKERRRALTVDYVEKHTVNQ